MASRKQKKNGIFIEYLNLAESIIYRKSNGTDNIYINDISVKLNVFNKNSVILLNNFNLTEGVIYINSNGTDNIKSQMGKLLNKLNKILYVKISIKLM